MSKKRQLFFVGDLHMDIDLLLMNIKKNEIQDSDIVCCGDIGAGFRGFEYKFDVDEDWGTKIVECIDKNRNNIYCIRGNHDNPEWFVNKPLKEVLKSKGLKYDNCPLNIFMCADYHVLYLDRANVICIGGGFSSDADWRKEHQSDDNPLWWEGEMPTFNIGDRQYLYNRLKGMLEANPRKPIIVAAHSAPIFCTPHEKWHGDISDDELLMQNNIERAIMGCVYYRIKKTIEENVGNYHWDNYKSLLTKIKGPSINWFYGHFHERNLRQKHLGDYFHGLSILDMIEFPVKPNKRQKQI